MTNGQISFQNPPRGVPSTTSPTGPSNNRYSQPPNKGLGKKASKHNLNNTQPSISAIFAQPSSWPVENTTIGERIAPMTVIVIIVIVTHTLLTCVGHHQNLPLPLPHNLLFVFTVVVQTIGQWSAVTTLEITERKDVHPAQHQTGTTMKNNGNLLWLLAKIHKSPMVSQEIMTNLGPLAKILRNPKQVGNIINSNNIPHKANEIIIAFLTGITDTKNNQDRQGSMRSRINYIPPITLPLHLHSLQDLTCLVI